jgi:predicted dinucleotide-binding enzyme
MTSISDAFWTSVRMSGGSSSTFAAASPVAIRSRGKVVVDITNPVDTETWDDLATPPGTSSAEEVAQLVPEGTPVVKAFNTTLAPTLVAGEVGGQQLDVMIAGDDDTAKEKVAQLVADGGLRPLDVGPLRRARQLEHMGFLHIAVQQPLGLGFGSTFTLHS